MTSLRWALLFVVFLASSLLSSQCAKDDRTNKNGGIVVTDFTITGTQTISATDLAGITGAMIGGCYDDDSDEMEERVRALFQDRGYFQVEVKSLRFKPRDPLGVPKPVTLEGELSEGSRYKLGQVSFVQNRAFTAEELREQFPIKKGALMEREKIAMGLDSVRKLYATRGYLDYVSIPETTFSSNAVVDFRLTFEEGPQYHMGKLEIVAEKELAARLHAAWKLAEGDVYDNTYLDDFLAAAHTLLPANFSRANVQIIQNCPEALIHLRLIIDPTQDTSKSVPKSVPCEEHDKESK